MISRRKLVYGTVAGALVGITGVALTRNDASIRFIGRRNTIISRLDTSTERILVILGERDDELLEFVPGLKTVGNTRTDLVIASHHILTTRAARDHLHLDSTASISVQASASLPPIRGVVTPVTSSATLRLGGSTEITINVAGSEVDHPAFLVMIKSHGTHLQLASGLSALRMNDIGSPDLLALPGSSVRLSKEITAPQVLVCNARNEELDIPQVVVFPTDPTIIRLSDGQISVRDDQLSS